MNLTAIAGSTPPSPAPGAQAGANASRPEDSEFSRMLDGGADRATAADNTPAQAAAQQGRGSSSAPGGERAGDGREKTPGDTRARSARAADEAREPATAAPSQATGATPADEAATTTETPADGWPPPGLASLLGTAAAPSPAIPAAAPTPAGLATLPAMTTPPPEPAPTSASRPGIAAHALPPIATASPMAAALQGERAALAAAAQEAGAPTLPAMAVATDAGIAMATSPEGTPGMASFAAHLSAPAAATGAGPTTTAPPLSAPHAPTPQLHGEGFADDLGTHVQWLADQKIGHAHIRISPQELGPVEIRLQLDGDRISADFTSAQPEVRQALESSLPRLREMLGQHGFELAHAGVGQQSRQDGGGATGGRGSLGDGPGEAVDEAPAPTLARVMRHGLLDAYA